MYNKEYIFQIYLKRFHCSYSFLVVGERSRAFQLFPDGKRPITEPAIPMQKSDRMNDLSLPVLVSDTDRFKVRKHKKNIPFLIDSLTFVMSEGIIINRAKLRVLNVFTRKQEKFEKFILFLFFSLFINTENYSKHRASFDSKTKLRTR